MRLNNRKVVMYSQERTVNDREVHLSKDSTWSDGLCQHNFGIIVYKVSLQHQAKCQHNSNFLFH